MRARRVASLVRRSCGCAARCTLHPRVSAGTAAQGVFRDRFSCDKVGVGCAMARNLLGQSRARGAHCCVSIAQRPSVSEITGGVRPWVTVFQRPLTEWSSLWRLAD